MITRIELTSYRGFEKLDLDLGPYQVIVGPNGAGKTTLLDIPALIGDLLRENNACQNAFMESRESIGPRASFLPELIYKKKSDWFSIAVELELPQSIANEVAWNTLKAKHPIPREIARYELRFRVNANLGLEIVSEHLILYPKTALPPRSPMPGSRRIYGDVLSLNRYQHKTINRELGRDVNLIPETANYRHSKKNIVYTPSNSSILALSGIQFQDKNAFPAARWVFDFFTTNVLFLNPDWDHIREESKPGQQKDLGENVILLPSARNAVWIANDIKIKNVKMYERWIEHVKLAIPQIEQIDIRENPNNKALFFWIQYNGGFAISSSGLSDGTLRVMVLSLFAFMNNPPSLIVCEEPENGIHPKAVDVVLEALQCVHGSQVWVSTHSPVVVAATKLEHMLTAENDDTLGVRIGHAADHPMLQVWKENRTPNLATLYATGVLG